MENTEPSKITELYAVLGVNAQGDEGIASAVNPVTRIMEPLIGGEKRLQTVITLAKAGSKESGMIFELVKFTSRESIMTINDGMTYNELKG